MMSISPRHLLTHSLVFAALWVLEAGDLVRGAAPASPAPAGAEKTGESPLAVEPSTASLAGGKATLTLTTLRRRGTTYLGSYQIKVVPYFFKNETGKIFITISDPLLQKAKGGGVVEFGGKAVSDGAGKTRPVTVKTAPAGDAAAGTMTIVIPTENGDLVFKPAYRFVEQ